MKTLIKNFTILTFAKIMAMFILFIATSNLMIAVAADASTGGFTWDSFKTYAVQWILGTLASALTVIVGYIANLGRAGIKHFFDLIRTYVANTRLNEMLDDLEASLTNETTKIEGMAQEALKTNNDIDDKELAEICNTVIADAKKMWGDKTIAWAKEYRPMLDEWLLARAKAIVRGIIDRFRSRQSTAVIATTKSN